MHLLQTSADRMSCLAAQVHHTQVVIGCARAQMRSQEVHLLQVLERGRLVRVQRLGRHCWDDDALVLAVQTEAERRWQLLQVPGPVTPELSGRSRQLCLRSHLALQRGSWEIANCR